MSADDESRSANQPDPAAEPGSGAPKPHDARPPTPGTEDAAADDAQPRAPEASPGDAAGVTVNSAASLLGSSEASREVQSTDDMLSDDARARAEAVGKTYDSAAPDASALRDD
jgi:hypothetical protein